MFQMCGVFAEFERAMIQERVKAAAAGYSVLQIFFCGRRKKRLFPYFFHFCVL